MIGGTRKSEGLLLLVLLGAAGLLIFPCWVHNPLRDTGAFLYMGQRILAGDVPYRDFWDHKPPLIYFVNALGLAITGGSMYGVRLIETVSLLGGLFFGYAALRRAFGVTAAFFGSLIWILEMEHMLEFGNIPEEYALSVRFCILFVLAGMSLDGRNLFRWFCVGLLTGLCFLLKQNNAGLGIAAGALIGVLFLFDKKPGLLAARAGSAALGGLAAILPMVWYLVAHHAFREFWSSAFTFNIAYTAASPGDNFRSLLFELQGVRIAPVVLAAWAVGIALLRSRRKALTLGRILLIVAIVDLPIEIYSCSMGSRNYSHYLIAWLPAAAVLFAFLVWTFGQWTADDSRKTVFLSHGLLPCFGVLIAAAYLLPIANLVHYNFRKDLLRTEDSRFGQASAYVAENTSAGDYVLLWGAEGGINFASHRPSPATFFYQYAFTSSGYCTPAMMRQFCDQVVSRKPRLIIDTGNDSLPPLDPVRRARWVGPSVADTGIRRFYSFVNDAYDRIDSLGSWVVYRLRNTAADTPDPQPDHRPRQ